MPTDPSLGGAFGCGDAEHLLDPRELHARPAGGLAERALVAIDRGPALVGDELGLALAQQPLDRGGVGRGRACSGPLVGPASAKIASTVSWASFLFVPITPEGPRLIQPTAYSPGQAARRRIGLEDATTVVGDHAASARRRERRGAGMPR